MTATNHALTGAVIGLLIGNALIAVPASVASHFICDALPHFGSRLPDEVFLKTGRFKVLILVDALLCIVLVAVLALTRPEYWLLAAGCALLATSPDLLWLSRFRKANKGKSLEISSKFLRFASRIQWFSKPIGGVVELVWFIVGLAIIGMFVR